VHMRLLCFFLAVLVKSKLDYHKYTVYHVAKNIVFILRHFKGFIAN